MQEPIEPGCDERINSILWEKYLQQAQTALGMMNVTEAARMFEIAMEKCAVFGSDDWRTLETQRLLAMALVQAKDYAKAETVLSNLMMLLYGKFGGASAEVLEVVRLLAAVYEHQAMYRNAARLMLHVMQNHPARFTDPRNADFVAVQRKYRHLQAKMQSTSSDELISWMG